MHASGKKKTQRRRAARRKSPGGGALPADLPRAPRPPPTRIPFLTADSPDGKTIALPFDQLAGASAHPFVRRPSGRSFDLDPLLRAPFSDALLQSSHRLGQRTGLVVLEHLPPVIQRSNDEAKAFL